MTLKEKILKAGIDNVLFLIPMRPVRQMLFLSYTSTSDDPVLVPAKIVEDRYKVEDGYKITLKSIYEEFCEDSFYQSDLQSIIESGHAEMFVQMEK